MQILGGVLVFIGIVLTVKNRGIRLDLSRGKVRGIAGPVLIVLGVLMLAGVI